jgi:hypothetical protein
MERISKAGRQVPGEWGTVCMPTVLRRDGYRFFFFSNEGTEPPHIHVESGDSYAKFWLRPIKLARAIGFNSSELNELRLIVFENQILFKERWDGYFKHQ